MLRYMSNCDIFTDLSFLVVQAAPRKKYIEEELPEFLEKLEKLLKSNRGGDGFFVGDEVREFLFIFLCANIAL